MLCCFFNSLFPDCSCSSALTLARSWHRDDTTAAEQKFVEIAQAYEVLGDEKAREQYDRGSYAGASQGFGFERAASMFTENFGQSLARDWQPGSRVSGASASCTAPRPLALSESGLQAIVP